MSMANDKEWNDKVSRAYDCVNRMVREVGDAALSVLEKRYSDQEYLDASGTSEAALRKAVFMVFYVDAQ